MNAPHRAKILVTGASGNVARPIAERLLAAGHAIAVLTRSPDKVRDLAERGAEVALGAPDDVESLHAAFAGRDTVFWMTPPGYAVADYPAFQRQTARAGAAAIQRAGLKRVVNLSSFGAHLAEGVGPIAGLHAVEAILEAAGAPVLQLRPAVFFENYKSAAGSIAERGRVFIPVPGSVRTSMMAARDVAPLAAELLSQAELPRGRVFALHGPADLSHAEAAAELSLSLGRPVEHVEVTGEQAFAAMTGRGMSPSFATLLVELYAALAAGRLRSLEPRTPESTTPTTLGEWARDVLAPLLPSA